jgi:hypothetical protein
MRDIRQVICAIQGNPDKQCMARQMRIACGADARWKAGNLGEARQCICARQGRAYERGKAGRLHEAGWMREARQGKCAKQDRVFARGKAG